jgi:hypothetical protein
MTTPLEKIRNKTSETIQTEEMYEYPQSIREFLSKNGYPDFDRKYTNRSPRSFIAFSRYIPYHIDDREYGARNEEFNNIYYTHLNDPLVNEFIDAYIEDGQFWVHPFRKFERYDLIAERYYSNDVDWWVIPLFNKVSDPFEATLNFNVLRIPYLGFIERLNNESIYNWDGGQNII